MFRHLRYTNSQANETNTSSQTLLKEVYKTQSYFQNFLGYNGPLIRELSRLQWSLNKQQIIPRAGVSLVSKNYFAIAPPELPESTKKINWSKRYLRKVLSPNWFQSKTELCRLEQVFEVIGLTRPTRGDGPQLRHGDFVATELLGHFDEIFTDDIYISALKLNEEEEFYACLDRGVTQLSDYFDAKRDASRHIPEAQDLSYETISGVVQKLVYQICQVQ